MSDLMGDVERTVLQWVMVRGTVAHSDLHPLLEKARQATKSACALRVFCLNIFHPNSSTGTDRTSPDQVIGIINDALRPLCMKLAVSLRDDTGQKFISFVCDSNIS